ncbi:hypothetical protein ABTZ03_14215 [Kitasatospora sp. NPDC096077]|uniref:hypothetical protein n=1 Tax=Kitasatospora sp. NPDC096077 TaxID=3155544 RepID=UPI00332E57D1
MTAAKKSWYAVRCVFRWEASEGPSYEERLTLWRAGSSDEAIGRAGGGGGRAVRA